MVSIGKRSDRRNRLLRKRNSAPATNSGAKTGDNQAHEVSANILLQASDATQSLHDIALTLHRGLSIAQNNPNYGISAFEVNEAPSLKGVHLEITASVPSEIKVEPFFKELLQAILSLDTQAPHLNGSNTRGATPLLTAGPSDYVYA